METLLTLSVALFLGLMLSRLAKLVKLPAVTAYLVAGILVGPYCLGAFGIEGLGFTSMENVESFSLIGDVALGFIAFSIGNEFRLAQLKKTGKQATVIGIIQAVFTTLLVDAALIGVHLLNPEKFPLPAALVLGAVAAATAPAATLMVVRQYKAKGPLTDILLPIVALDDAVGLVLFAVSFGVAKALIHGKVDILYGLSYGCRALMQVLEDNRLEITTTIADGMSLRDYPDIKSDFWKEGLNMRTWFRSERSGCSKRSGVFPWNVALSFPLMRYR